MMNEAHMQGLNNILQMGVDAVSAQSICLYQYQVAEDCFKPLMSYSEGLDFDERPQKNKGLFKLAHKLDAPTSICQARVLYENHLYKQSLPLSCVWLMPIKKNNHFWGVLLIDFYEKKELLSKAESFLKHLSLQIWHELESLEEKQKFKTFQRELSMYVEAGNRLNKCFRLEEVYATAIESIQNMCACDEVFMISYDAEKKNCILESSLLQTMEDTVFAMDFRQNLISWVIENQKSLYYGDFKFRHGRSTLFSDNMVYENVYDSVFIVPMQVQKQKLGAIVILAQKNNAFSYELRHMLEVFSQHTAVAIKNAKMVDRLETLATTDGLTGILNHRSFQDVLDAELLRCKRHPNKMSVVLLDIDHFKTFNDNYGHPVGDQVLKMVAQKLKDSIRKIDHVFRYGGEEFALILVHTGAQEALALAQRIVKDIETSAFHVKDQVLNITVSMGVAAFPEMSEHKETLVKMSDQALYRSKMAGRNQATLYCEKSIDEKNTASAQRRVDLFSQSF